MIGYLEGTVLAHTDAGILLQVGPVGYDVFGTKLLSHQIGARLQLFCHHHHDNNNQELLIGFESLESRVLFRRLLKVPGIGPKTALSVIEANSSSDIQQAILDGDINFFTRVKGLGKKAAQKIILELKNQLVDAPSLEATHSYIYDALTALNFSRSEITDGIKSLDLSDLSESDSIKIILQHLGKRS